MYRYDLHIHTAECDKVAAVGGAEIVRLYKDAGYDGIVITDHYFALFFDWFKDEISTGKKESIINRYTQKKKDARERVFLFQRNSPTTSEIWLRRVK